MKVTFFLFPPHLLLRAHQLSTSASLLLCTDEGLLSRQQTHGMCVNTGWTESNQRELKAFCRLFGQYEGTVGLFLKQGIQNLHLQKASCQYGQK